ncbi:hypothetical protein NDU88_001207 [Pleurodeles waltl]|uniref:Uncharacterized protein n=1 Tax=Pleurodeles waltl TaxID=8319 RepID=A0AAV7Q3L4_PLEWA|nr:hypothetical protein NDU88_001207 [Pleurodeles waltl]
MYWSSTPTGIQGREHRGHTSSFQVCQVNDGKVKIIDYKGDDLGIDPSDVHNTAKAAKNTTIQHEFELYYQKEKVAFKASNGMFASRTYYSRNKTTIEAVKKEIDDTCLFDRVGADV